MQLLDKAGLTYFWEKLKDRFQAKLVSGTNIKTINGESVLGSGDIGLPIKSGYTSAGTISANSYKDVTINHNFGTNQVYVVATMFSSGTAVNIGNTTIAVHDISTNTAEVRVFNNRSSTISPAIEWIAFKP